MVELHRTELNVRAERAVLVQVRSPRAGRASQEAAGGAAGTLAEIRGLAATARANVVGELTQARARPHTATYLGRGKVAELEGLCRSVDADMVICDDDLSPGQVRGLESALGLKVIDRSELILDIFATHARTRQAMLQVELAQLEYTFPRLKMMWGHLDRVVGGVGVRGPGERQLEIDRRLVQKRIKELKKSLAKIDAHRQRMARARGRRFPTVALVGYTNAGKSTLMNALTGADMVVRDRLFETLDTRTRQWTLEDGRQVMLSDTVGFIRKLPHHLVASFRATLEEAREADLLLHVADAASGAVEAQIEAVGEVLTEIDCADKPQLLALNKLDALDDEGSLRLPPLRRMAAHSIGISAASGHGLDELGRQVGRMLDECVEDTAREVELIVEAPLINGKLISLLHEKGDVLESEYQADSVRIRVRVAGQVRGAIESLGGKTVAVEAGPPAHGHGR